MWGKTYMPLPYFENIKLDIVSKISILINMFYLIYQFA